MNIPVKTRYNYILPLVLLSAFLSVQRAEAAVLKISPNSGSFTVGEAVEMSLYLDTEGQKINTIKAALYYPVDKLQLISPEAGNSIVGIWAGPLIHNNQKGKVELTGGIPGGIATKNGLVYNFSFQVKSSGTAILRVGSESFLMLNDGKGTKAVPRLGGAILELAFLPPVGPVVVSPSHPDQGLWYRQNTAAIEWANEEDVSGYSYMLSKNPGSVPDDIPDKKKPAVIYENLSDGTHYFHVKSMRDGVWGETAHYAVNIDTAPPAEFPIEVLPGLNTIEKRPVIKFAAVDNLSGIGRYEIMFIPLQEKGTVSAAESSDGQMTFTEATSPFIPDELAPQDYDVIVRAYDAAGNYSSATRRVRVAVQFYRSITSEGVMIGNFLIPWSSIIIFGILLVIGLTYAAYRTRKEHHYYCQKRCSDDLSQEVKSQLSELKRFKEKYGKMAVFAAIFFSTLFFSVQVSLAAGDVLKAPAIGNFSAAITDEEIFYAGGTTELPGVEVLLYLQNVKSGEIIETKTVSNKRSEWLYRHNNFLPGGEYSVWAKSKKDGTISDSSPRVKIVVQKKALRFWSISLDRGYLYLVIFCAMVSLSCLLTIYIIIRRRSIRKNRRSVDNRIIEVETAIRHDFLMLKRDIEKEIGLIEKAELRGPLSAEEKEAKKRLISDMERIQDKIKKERMDIEKLG